MDTFPRYLGNQMLLKWERMKRYRDLNLEQPCGPTFSIFSLTSISNDITAKSWDQHGG